jgi:hypothetical protein
MFYEHQIIVGFCLGTVLSPFLNTLALAVEPVIELDLAPPCASERLAGRGKFPQNALSLRELFSRLMKIARVCKLRRARRPSIPANDEARLRQAR